MIHIDWNWIKQRPQFLAESMEEYYDINIVYIKPLRVLFKPNNIHLIVMEFIKYLLVELKLLSS